MPLPPLPPNLKFDAEVLRLELVTGVSEVSEVVAWADRVVLADLANDAPVLFDLSLAANRSVAEVVSLLGEVPGKVEPADVGRRVAGELARRLTIGGSVPGLVEIRVVPPY